MDTNAAWFVTLVTVLNIASGVYYVFWMIANWRIFEKAGEKGWKTLVPFYNLFVQYRLTWKAYMAIPVIVCSMGGALMAQNCTGTLSTVGSLISIVGSVLNIVGLNKLSKAFGHGKGFTFGLWLLQPIFIMILGFGKDQFLGVRPTLSR